MTIETTTEQRETGMAVRDESLSISFVIGGETVAHRLAELRAFVDGYMEKGIDGDYGVIPGTKKLTLLKPGAEKLCDVYALTPTFEVIGEIEDWDKPLFYYKLKCQLTSRQNGLLITEGFGSCNSMEDRYRWRQAERTCPECGNAAIIKGKAEYGGGFVCFGKKGGCGAKFSADDQRITGQLVGRVENEDIYSQVNTVLKMAKKRALVDAVISATRSSNLFTQDMDDSIEAREAAPLDPTPAWADALPRGGDNTAKLNLPRRQPSGPVVTYQIVLTQPNGEPTPECMCGDGPMHYREGVKEGKAWQGLWCPTGTDPIIWLHLKATVPERDIESDTVTRDGVTYE